MQQMKIKPTNLKGFLLFFKLITKTEILKEKLQFELLIPITELNKKASIKVQAKNIFGPFLQTFLSTHHDAAVFRKQLYDNYVKQLREQVEQIDAKIKKYKDIASSTPRTIEDVRRVLRNTLFHAGILMELNSILDLVTPCTDLIVLLPTSIIQPRHSQQLFERTGVKATYHTDIQLQELLAIGMFKFQSS